jgi:hypothetical protein
MPEHLTRILAAYLDDCWEPENAVRILRTEAPAGIQVPATATCLRVPGGDEKPAEVLGTSACVPDAELAGEAEYLWVLAAGGPPQRDFLLRLYGEFKASRGDACRLP